MLRLASFPLEADACHTYSVGICVSFNSIRFVLVTLIRMGTCITIACSNTALVGDSLVFPDEPQLFFC